MALLLVGSNHQTAPLELRERLYVCSDLLQNMMSQLHLHSQSISELAIISTCNRFEVYASVSDKLYAQRDMVDFMCEYFSIAETELLPRLYMHQDDMAIRHLMTVSTGLNSMVLGEAQILGQVSKALENASAVKTTGAYLHRLFEAAIHAGKRARTETAISQHTTSISHAAALLMWQKIKKSDPKVLILGAGEMAELAVYALHRHSLSHIGIINRTHAKAQALASKFGVKAHSWSQLEAQLLDADVLITATGAPHTLIHADYMQRIMQQRQGHDLMLIDIALPRDVAPEVRHIQGIALFDIDSLQDIVDNNLAARESCIPQVEGIIEQELERYQQWLKERAIVPVIKDLRHEVAILVENELNDAINKMPDISDAELAVVRRMAHRIMNKVLHAPTKMLRSHATEDDTEAYASMVRDLFALDTDTSDQRHSA